MVAPPSGSRGRCPVHLAFMLWRGAMRGAFAGLTAVEGVRRGLSSFSWCFWSRERERAVLGSACSPFPLRPPLENFCRAVVREGVCSRGALRPRCPGVGTASGDPFPLNVRRSVFRERNLSRMLRSLCGYSTVPAGLPHIASFFAICWCLATTVWLIARVFLPSAVAVCVSRPGKGSLSLILRRRQGWRYPPSPSNRRAFNGDEVGF